MEYEDELNRWIEKANASLTSELKALANDEETLADAFRCELVFGTGGLRGIIGAGPNRMNIHTVAKATQGLADYLNETCECPSVAVARDSRNMGGEFVRTVAGVLAANGVRAFVYPRPVPTPALSFAVRYLYASAGINVTASHNPAAYNGYKVYGSDGCQITSDMAAGIQKAIDDTDVFEDVRCISLEEGIEQGLVSWIAEDTLASFLDAVEEQSLAMPFAKGESDSKRGLSVVYTALNGVGFECVSSILKRVGVSSVVPVAQQVVLNGDFPTCPYPNPEFREALELGLSVCQQCGADLLLATDPDTDRVGIAVRHNGAYELLTGNEVGVLLVDYICKARAAQEEDLTKAVAISTIVSSAMVDALAEKHGFQMRRTLTGFKYIGEQIALLESQGEASRYVFGFEESYGYLAGTHVRDKDAVVASMLICQMAQYYLDRGMDLVQAMEALYEEFGRYINLTVNMSYPGAAGAQKMKELTSGLRANPPATIAGMAVERTIDYMSGAQMPVVNPLEGEPEQTLPCADVMEFQLAGGSKLLVRPSGTEPKIKAYIFAYGKTLEQAQQQVELLKAAAEELLS